MLRTGEDVLTVCNIVSLIAADDRGAQLARKIRVFAKGLVDPAPARIAPQAQHGRKRPVQSVRRDFARGHTAHLLRKHGVPGAGKRELGRKDRSLSVESVAVDGVDAKEHGDAEARLHRLTLNLPRVFAHHMQKRTRAAPCPKKRLFPRDIGKRHLHHLRRLFRQCHAGQDFVDAGFYRGSFQVLHGFSFVLSCVI